MGEECENAVRMILQTIQKILSFGFSDASSTYHARGRQRRILNAAAGNKSGVAFAPSAEMSGGDGRSACAMTFDKAMHGEEEKKHFPGPALTLLLKEKREFAKQMGVA